MKTIIVLISSFLLLIKLSLAQTTIHPSSGWYLSDSIFVIITPPHPDAVVLYSVNSTSENDFEVYKSGFWIYPRSENNTWENQQLSKDFGEHKIEGASRNPLKKATIIRTRTYTPPDKVSVEEQIAYIHVGELNPHKYPLVYLFCDSSDTFGAKGFYGPGEGAKNILNEFAWNYDINGSAGWNVKRSRYEKSAFVQIIDTTAQVILNKAVGIRLSGDGTLSLPNKTIAIVARAKYSKNFISSHLFSAEETHKWLKFRTRIDNSFGDNEMALDLLQGLNMGETPYRQVVVYLNGSYWTLAFAQDKTNEVSISQHYNVSLDSMSLSVPYGDWFKLKQQKLNSLVKKGLDTTKVALVKDNKQWYGVAEVKSNKAMAQTWHQQVFDSLLHHDKKDLSPEDVYNRYVKYIDLDNLCRYVSFVNFIGQTDAIQNNVTLFLDTSGLMKFLAKDFDNSFHHPEVNTWRQYPFTCEGLDNTVRHLLCDFLFVNNLLTSRLVAVYQDLLNTSFLPQRCLAVVDEFFKKNADAEEISRLSHAWQPFSSVDSFSIKSKQQTVVNFMTHRNDYAWLNLANRWPYIVGDSVTLNSRNTIRICMDSVKERGVVLKLNSLQIDTSWQGTYYPNPPVRISALAIPPGYNLIWKEYKDSTNLTLSLEFPITITPLLVEKTKSIR